MPSLKDRIAAQAEKTKQKIPIIAKELADDDLQVRSTDHMREEFRKRIAAASGDGTKIMEISTDYAAHLEFVKANNLEETPRETVVKMLSAHDGKLDIPFTFKVRGGTGEDYIQAMRQVLSRVRNKAKAQKLKLAEFKVLIREVKTENGIDYITLVRTKTMDAHQESVYDDIIKLYQETTAKEGTL